MHERRNFKRPVAIKMGIHLPGMHAGISPPGAGEFDHCVEQNRTGLVQRFLHGNGIGLVLPAVVMGSVVGEFDEISQLLFDLK